MGKIADMFAAELADWKRQSDETDRKLLADIAAMHQTLGELKRINDAMLEELEA